MGLDKWIFKTGLPTAWVYSKCGTYVFVFRNNRFHKAIAGTYDYISDCEHHEKVPVNRLTKLKHFKTVNLNDL